MGVPELLEIKDALVEFQVAKSHLEDACSSLHRALTMLEGAGGEEAKNLRWRSQRILQILRRLISDSAT